MSVDLQPDIAAQLLDIQAKLAEILGALASPRAARESYSTEEVAKLLGKSDYTVREYCRLGRINATKRQESRGGAALWSISAAEVARLKDHGLLPIDSNRNGSRRRG